MDYIYNLEQFFFFEIGPILSKCPSMKVAEQHWGDRKHIKFDLLR